MHNKVIIKRTQLPDGQYIDNFIDVDTGEIYKKFTHVLDGTTQEKIKIGVETSKVYVEWEVYSDDTATEGFKGWLYSFMNSGYDDTVTIAQLLTVSDIVTATKLLEDGAQTTNKTSSLGKLSKKS